jgi:hypothetical protein
LVAGDGLHLTKEELEERFSDVFCGYTPKVIMLAGMGYRPKDMTDLNKRFEQQ